MELSKAIEIVTSYLPKLAFLGKEVNEAAALVTLAAVTYEKSTWAYYYRYTKDETVGEWLPGFPDRAHAETTGTTVEQIRGRGDEAVQVGVWSSPETPLLPPLVILMDS